MAQNFSNFKMKQPASSSYWEVKFISTQDPNTVETTAGMLFPASNVVFDLVGIEYETVEIFSEKIFYIKNIQSLKTISVEYIEDEALSITKFHKDWITSKNNASGIKNHRNTTPDIKKDFSERLSIKKYASDFKTLVLELEVDVIPADGIAFTFDWDDSTMQKSINYQIVNLVKFEMYGKFNPNTAPMAV